MVLQLNDDNGDGRIDEFDLPSVVINTGHDNDSIRYQHVGKLWAFRGDSGAQLFTQYVTDHPSGLDGVIASGDINGDRKPELIVVRRPINGSGLLAFGNDGALLWDNQANVIDWNSSHVWNKVEFAENAPPVLTDMDGDGKAEIVAGRAVMNGDGTVRCAADTRSGGYGTAGNSIHSMIVADVDLDGKPDIIAGNSVYNDDCTIKWWKSDLPDDLTAVGNFNDDAYPEIVLARTWSDRANRRVPPFISSRS